VEGHDGAAQHVAHQQAHDGPEGIRPEYHGKGAIHDGGDLRVGAEPQGELAPRVAVALTRRDHVNRTCLYGGTASGHGQTPQ
jgi:hypothetical protein